MINLNGSFPANSTAPTANYPFGGSRNVSTPLDGTGTPWTTPMINDVFGYQQAVLSLANITPNNVSETALVSQQLQAQQIIGILNWTAGTSYPINAFAIGSDGEIYQTTAVTVGQDPIAGAPWVSYNGIIAPQSSQTTSGLIEIASAGEASTGTDNTRAITPLTLQNGLNGVDSGLVAFGTVRTKALTTEAQLNINSVTASGVGGVTISLDGGTSFTHITLTSIIPPGIALGSNLTALVSTVPPAGLTSIVVEAHEDQGNILSGGINYNFQFACYNWESLRDN